MDFKKTGYVSYDAKEVINSLGRVGKRIHSSYVANLRIFSRKRGQVLKSDGEAETVVQIFFPLSPTVKTSLWEEEYQEKLPKKLKGKGVALWVPSDFVRINKTLTFEREDK